ncbi:hypothetical protein LQW54_012638 [Pestalotiopsis sp. IQ-011]
MASRDHQAQHSHRHSTGTPHRRRSDSLGHGRSRQTSNASLAPSFAPSALSPSFTSRLSTATSPAYRTSASFRDEPVSSDSPSPLESIPDTPFFQRQSDADSAEAAARKPIRSPVPESVRHETPPPKLLPVPRIQVPRRVSSDVEETDDRPPAQKTMESINIVVIGANGVGKSHFIQKALSLTRTPGSQPSTARINIDHVPYAVTLFELDLEYFDVDPDKQIQWPRQVGGAMMPAIHGVLLLYDVMNRESIIELPQTLTALVNSSLPTILVATKCDNPESARQIDTEGLAAACKSCIGSFKTASSKPESARMPLSFLLKALIINRQAGVGLDHDSANDETTVSSMLRTTGIRLDRPGTGTFRELDESDGDTNRFSEDIPILQRDDDLNFDRPAKKIGLTFDELVDRLIAPKFSRADSNFSDVFLCLYRKFAAPSALLSAILTRLERVKEEKPAHYLTKTATQLRIIESVAKWVSFYPADFAKPTIRRNLEEFIRNLSAEPIFSAAAQQMRRVLDLSVLEEDDSGWVKDDDAESTSHTSLPKASSISLDLPESMSLLSVSEPPVDRRPSASSSLLTDSSNSMKFHQFQFHSYEDYEHEAATMVPTYTMPLTKFRYHIFMDTSDDDIADELTRIDWVMFSSIRIRDLVRHVSLNASQKENSQSMKNVNRMINHFNHIAKWVANMVLMRDKAKHRAQMLEKFMNIALKLRQLNNYNGLAAVLAGINGTAVHRLSQTRNLVAADVQKRFARLVLLMGSQKSHFAYRLAWENSPLPRIPYMPLHRRDLVSAEEGSMTFLGQDGERINWKKYEILGEIILPIIKSQGTPYPNLTKHDTARELILDCLMPTDEEDIYQRSCQVENPAGGSYDGKKKFPWFAKQ